MNDTEPAAVGSGPRRPLERGEAEGGRGSSAELGDWVATRDTSVQQIESQRPGAHAFPEAAPARRCVGAGSEANENMAWPLSSGRARPGAGSGAGW